MLLNFVEHYGDETMHMSKQLCSIGPRAMMQPGGPALRVAKGPVMAVHAVVMVIVSYMKSCTGRGCVQRQAAGGPGM